MVSPGPSRAPTGENGAPQKTRRGALVTMISAAKGDLAADDRAVCARGRSFHIRTNPNFFNEIRDVPRDQAWLHDHARTMPSCSGIPRLGPAGTRRPGGSYERRAFSRRKFAIRAFEEAKRQTDEREPVATTNK
jgi:hypothetical protein